MGKFILLTTAAVVAAAAASATTLPAGFKGANLAPKAQISLNTARATALAVHRGTITDQELETEKGGSGLRYSFDVKSGGKTFEVGIDAKTGKVLENDPEGPNAD